MPQTAFADRVFHSRAVCTPGVSIDDDPEPMVHQQFARLRFFEQTLGTAGLRALDWGCGSGYNCRWLADEGRAADVLGFDLLGDAVGLARQTYPGIDFEVADACAADLSLRPGEWDRILSCEVIEHVPDVGAFLRNVRRHLAPGGSAFVTTPNRLVFSLGHEPSPVNREHVKEFTLEEYADLLRPHFSHVEIFGQRFRDPALLRTWEDDVRGKIAALKAGTRWAEKPSLRAAMRRWRVVDWAYRMPALRSAWKAIRWDLPGRLRRAVPKPLPYRWTDFEFVAADEPGVLWFCAVLRA